MSTQQVSQIQWGPNLLNNKQGGRGQSICKVVSTQNVNDPLAGGFWALQYRISCKICLEPLMDALSSCSGFVNVFFNFIQDSLSTFWSVTFQMTIFP